MRTLRRFLLSPLHWLLEREPGLFEFVTGLATFGWGALTFQRFPPNDTPATLDVFRQLGIECGVAAGALVLGIGQMFAFDLIDRRWAHHWLRLIGAAAAVSFWAALCFNVISSGAPFPPMSMVAPALLIGNLALIGRILRRWA